MNLPVPTPVPTVRSLAHLGVTTVCLVGSRDHCQIVEPGQSPYFLSPTRLRCRPTTGPPGSVSPGTSLPDTDHCAETGTPGTGTGPLWGGIRGLVGEDDESVRAEKVDFRNSG